MEEIYFLRRHLIELGPGKPFPYGVALLCVLVGLLENGRFFETLTHVDE